MYSICSKLPSWDGIVPLRSLEYRYLLIEKEKKKVEFKMKKHNEQYFTK